MCVFQEYKRKLARVTQVRKGLRFRLNNLPDLSLLPNVTGGHLHLPSSGDLYNPSDWLLICPPHPWSTPPTHLPDSTYVLPYLVTCGLYVAYIMGC